VAFLQNLQPVRAPRPEILPGLVFLAAGLACGGLALFRAGQPVSYLRLELEGAALLALAAGGFLSTFLTARARERGPRARAVFVRHGARPLPAWLDRVRRGFDRAYAALANTDWLGDWLPLAIVVLFALAALAALARAWPLLAAAPPSPRQDEWIGGVLVVLAFPVLVLERRFAGMPPHRAADAPALTKLLRLLLAGLLGLALVCLLHWLGLAWAVAAERIVILFTGLVAAETALSAAAYVFLPLPPLAERRSHADTLTAGLIRLQRPSLRAINASVRRQFGIDLGRSWALGFIRRAAFPALLLLVLAGWLLTGITALGLDQRAVYEAFGRPEAVFHSGLHVHLPWPFGVLKPVEYGTVREIPIVFGAEGSEAAEAGTQPGTIEGVPPPSDDRLWDTSHPSEASYLVASTGNGGENFEVANIDLRILYRIGLGDAAAMQAVYSIAAPDMLIRAAAGRMLARYFARYTIDDVLGQNREAFIRGFQKELQSRLDALSSGVDILGVVVEAIHPPPAAAAAYQGVQAAAIQSITAIATARGEATRVVKQAQTTAERMRAEAAAQAAETVDGARENTTLFLGDVEADHRDGDAFLFERRLGAIAAALQPSVPSVIVDHRISPATVPTLDLRPPGSSNFVPQAEGGDD